MLYSALQDEIDDAISDTITNSSFIRGPQVDLFENNFSTKDESKYCISCANGTFALYIAMKELGKGTCSAYHW